MERIDTFGWKYSPEAPTAVYDKVTADFLASDRRKAAEERQAKQMKEDAHQAEMKRREEAFKRIDILRLAHCGEGPTHREWWVARASSFLDFTEAVTYHGETMQDWLAYGEERKKRAAKRAEERKAKEAAYQEHIAAKAAAEREDKRRQDAFDRITALLHTVGSDSPWRQGWWDATDKAAAKAMFAYYRAVRREDWIAYAATCEGSENCRKIEGLREDKRRKAAFDQILAMLPTMLPGEHVLNPEWWGPVPGLSYRGVSRNDWLAFAETVKGKTWVKQMEDPKKTETVRPYRITLRNSRRETIGPFDDIVHVEYVKYPVVKLSDIISEETLDKVIKQTSWGTVNPKDSTPSADAVHNRKVLDQRESPLSKALDGRPWWLRTGACGEGKAEASATQPAASKPTQYSFPGVTYDPVSGEYSTGVRKPTSKPVGRGSHDAETEFRAELQGHGFKK